MSVYAFSDLHGQYKLWEQIKAFIQPEDKVFCLGDCADRGPEGWQIIKEVLATPNITYLRGNHEQFIIDEDYWLWRYNGGDFTIEAAEQDTDEEWIRIKTLLQQTSYITDYTNIKGDKIALCHAGFDPKYIAYKDDDALIWDREHLAYDWPEGWEDLIIVHGHTPIPYLPRYVRMVDPMPQPNQAYWYCDQHKCCIDMLSFQSKKAILLDLDTFEEHLFTEK